MKKLKKLLLSLACFALGAALTLVGTLAYLQDETDTAYNVMTSGNVKIEQLELERKAGSLVDFNVGKPADPAVYNDANVSKDVSINWSNLGYNGASDLYADSIGNVVDHFVFVKNTGKNAAYVRTVIAIECPNGFNADNIHINKTESDAIVWTNFTTTIEGVQYLLLVATYKDAVAGGATTAPSLLQLYLDPTVVNEDTEKFGDTWDVLVISQAVQTTGFEAPDGVLPADHALDKAFGDVNSINTPWDDKEVTIPAIANDAAELRALLDRSSEIVVYGDMNAVGTVDVPSWTDAPAEFIIDATVTNKISGGNFVLDQASRYGIVARISTDETLSISDMQITANSQWPVYLANWGGNLVVSDVTIEAEAGAGIYPYGTDGTTVLNNVKVNQNRLDPAYSATTPWAATAVATSNGHNLVINSGNYVGSKYGVYVYNSGATVTINGGTFKAPTVIQLDGVWSGSNKSVATVNGGNFDGAILLDVGNNAPELYINGGNFTNFSATVKGAAKLVITGGTFDADPSAYVAEGYLVRPLANGKFAVISENDTWDGTVDTEWYAAGNTKYELYTAEQLAGLAALTREGNTFKGITITLKVNVNLNGIEWTSTGAFGGTFDAEGKTISGLLMNGTSNVGFFGSLNSTAKITNVVFDKASVSGNHYVGVILGWESNESANATISNVTVKNSAITCDTDSSNDNGDKAGALVGYAVSLNIENCVSENNTVKAYRDFGGIIGYAHKACVITGNNVINVTLTIDNDVNYKNYTTDAEYDAGAIVGEANSSATIKNNKLNGNTYVESTEDLKDILASGEGVSLGVDVQWSNAINNNATIDLNGNTFEAMGTINLVNNADLTMVGGNYEVNGTYGHIDVRPDSAEGSTLYFEDMVFTSNYLNKTWGTCTDRLVSVVELCASVDGATAYVTFKNCTFNNASVLLEGMSGKVGKFVVVFENCTFNALTSGSPIEVMNYVEAEITVKGCTFNLECTSGTASAVSVSPSSSTTVTLNAENNIIDATAATPSGEAGTVEQVKVNGTPANIKFASFYENVTANITGTTATGIAVA